MDKSPQLQAFLDELRWDRFCKSWVFIANAVMLEDSKYRPMLLMARIQNLEAKEIIEQTLDLMGEALAKCE